MNTKPIPTPADRMRADKRAERERLTRTHSGVAMNAITLNREPAPHPADAFRTSALKKNEQRCQKALAAAQAVMNAARGKAATKTARIRVKVARDALRHAQAASKAEADGEKAAPAVRRDEIAHLGTILREPMVEMRGPRAELVSALKRLHARNTITDNQFRAGRRYRQAWESAGRDQFPIGVPDGGVRSPPSAGNRRIEESVASYAELNAARVHLGPSGTALVEHIVVHGLTLMSWSQKRQESEHLAPGAFIMLLQQLYEFWWPKEQEAEKRRLQEAALADEEEDCSCAT